MYHQAVTTLTRVNSPLKAKNSLIHNLGFGLYVPLSYRREAYLKSGKRVSNKLILEQFNTYLLKNYLLFVLR